MSNGVLQYGAAGAIGGFARGFLPGYLKRKKKERQEKEQEKAIEEITESIARITGISEERVRDWVVARGSDMPVPFEALEKDPVKREDVAQKVLSEIRSKHPDLADSFESRWRFDEDLEPALDFLQQSEESQIEINKGHQALGQLYGYVQNGLKDENYFIPNPKTGMTYFEAIEAAAEPLQAVMPKEDVAAMLQKYGIDMEIDKNARAEAKLRKFFVNADGSTKKRDEWSQEDIRKYGRLLDISLEKAEDEVDAYYKKYPAVRQMTTQKRLSLYSAFQANLHGEPNYIPWLQEKGDDKFLPEYALLNRALHPSGALKWPYFDDQLAQAATPVRLNDRERAILESLERNYTGESKDYWRKELDKMSISPKGLIGPGLPLPKDEIERILEVFFAGKGK